MRSHSHYCAHCANYIHLFYVEELQNGQQKIMYLVKHTLDSAHSTVDACFTLNLLVNRNVSDKRKLCCAFFDFSTAFDSVCRNIHYEKLKECGISTKMLKMIMAIYKNVTSSVKINNIHTD